MILIPEIDDTDTDTDTITGTRRKRKRDKPDTNPNAWMEKFDYKNLSNLGQQTSDSLKKAPVGGVIGAFINGQNAAQAAANIIILDLGYFCRICFLQIAIISSPSKLGNCNT